MRTTKKILSQTFPSLSIGVAQIVKREPINILLKFLSAKTTKWVKSILFRTSILRVYRPQSRFCERFQIKVWSL